MILPIHNTQDAFAIAARRHIQEAFTRMRAQKHSTKMNETDRSSLRQAVQKHVKNVKLSTSQSQQKESQISGLLVIPRIAKSTKGGRTFSYLTPKLWNSLPDNVRGSDTLSLFKSRLKTHLFSQAFI